MGSPGSPVFRIRDYLPSSAALLVAAVAVCFRIPYLGLASVGAVVALSPVASTLGTRVLLWLVGSLAATSVLARAPGLVLSESGALGLLVTGWVLAVVVGARRPQIVWRPIVGAADWIVVVGAVAVGAVLALPLLGLGEDGVLLDLARGFDNVEHFTMVKNTVEVGNSWTVFDGSAAVRQEYPHGAHWLAGLALEFTQPGVQTASPRAFAAISVFGASLSAFILGWLAVRIAQGTGREREKRRRGIVSAIAFAVVAPLGGTLSGVYELGHSFFLVPLAAAVACSFLACTVRSTRPGSALLLLGVGVVGVWGSYPPLVGGLLPAALTWPPTSAQAARRILLAKIVVVSVAGIALVVGWWRTFAVLAVAEGECSTPVAVSLLTVVAASLLAIRAREAGYPRPGGDAMLPVLGYSGTAVAMAGLALSAGSDVGSNYYVAKFLQGSWLAAMPVVIGLGTGLVVAHAGSGSSRARPTLVAGVLMLMLGLVALPDGRYHGVAPGLLMLERRLHESAVAGESVQVVQAASALGPGRAAEASVMVEPQAWRLPVAMDDPRWTKPASVASLWLNALRGVRTTAQDELALCMDELADPRSIPCIRNWLNEHPASHVVLVLSESSSSEAFERLVRDAGGRVDSYVLPSGPRLP